MTVMPVVKTELSTKVFVRNLDFFYGDQRALKDVTIGLHTNKVTAFIGPSGCGKSTLFACLTGCTISIPSSAPRAR